MREGWFKMQRCWLENGVICKDNDHLSVWVTLLNDAVYEEVQTVFNGQPTTLTPGELITGRAALSAKSRVQESKVTRILTRFQKAGLIEQTCKKGGRLIRLTPPEKYSAWTDTEQITDRNRTNGEQMVNTIKEYNKANKARAHMQERTRARWPDCGKPAQRLSTFSSDASYDLDELMSRAIGMRDDVEYEI